MTAISASQREKLAGVPGGPEVSFIPEMIGAAHISAGRGRGENPRGGAKKRVNQQACSRNGGGPCHPEVQSPSP